MSIFRRAKFYEEPKTIISFYLKNCDFFHYSKESLCLRMWYVPLPKPGKMIPGKSVHGKMVPGKNGPREKSSPEKWSPKNWSPEKWSPEN